MKEPSSATAQRTTIPPAGDDQPPDRQPDTAVTVTGARAAGGSAQAGPGSMRRRGATESAVSACGSRPRARRRSSAARPRLRRACA